MAVLANIVVTIEAGLAITCQCNGGVAALFGASNRVKQDAKYDCDMLDARLRKHDDVTTPTFMYADKDYVVPLFVNGFSTYGIRDSGCNFVGLVAKHLVRPESINYQKRIKGAFDGDKNHKVPTAVVKIRSPRFLYDQDIKVMMGVSDKLPQGVNCLLGNDLFRRPHGAYRHNFCQTERNYQ